jgi:hypothetical protein
MAITALKTEKTNQGGYGYALILAFDFVGNILPTSGGSALKFSNSGDTWEVQIVKPSGQRLIKTTAAGVSFPNSAVAEISVPVEANDLDEKGTYYYQVYSTTGGTSVPSTVKSFEIEASLPAGVAPNSIENPLNGYFGMFGAQGQLTTSTLRVVSGVLQFAGNALGDAASNRARANHTGTQAISTVTGLQTALDGKLSASALPEFRLTDFGAVADDSTNCGPALQAALDAAYAGGKGGVIVFPRGTIRLPSTHAQAHKDFNGQKAMLIFRGSGDSIVHLHNPATGYAGGGFAVSCQNLEKVLFEHIQFHGTPTNNINAVSFWSRNQGVLYFGGCLQATVKNCVFSNIAIGNTGGLIYANASGLTVEDNMFGGNACPLGGNIFVFNGKYFISNNNHFVDFSQDIANSKVSAGGVLTWIRVDAMAQNDSGFETSNAVITNCRFDEAAANTALINDLKFVTWQNNSANLQGVAGSKGLKVTNAKTVLAERSAFGYAPSSSLAAVSATNVDAVKIVDCILRGGATHIELLGTTRKALIENTTLPSATVNTAGATITTII